MTESQHAARFEQLLTAETYACAWGYARQLALSSRGGRADAEDLLQESLVRAWRGMSSLRDEGRFRGWLLSILRRTHLNRLRRERSERNALPPAVGIAPELLEELAADAADPDAVSVLEVLARLPDGPRELLSLVYVHGLTLTEAGQVLSIAPRAVRMRLSRARRLLRLAADKDGIPTGAGQAPVRRST